jgi:hypothetical protein
MRRLLVLLPALLLAGIHLADTAMADGLNVDWRQAKVIRLAKPATSVIIGDPTVADVTLSDPKTVIIFGKAPGETNMVVLSASQELLFDWPVVVNPLTSGHVSIVNAQTDPAPSEVLYSCGVERCVRVLSPTDVQFKSTTSTSTTNSSDASKNTSVRTEPTVTGSTAPADGTSQDQSTSGSTDAPQ